MKKYTICNCSLEWKIWSDTSFGRMTKFVCAFQKLYHYTGYSLVSKGWLNKEQWRLMLKSDVDSSIHCSFLTLLNFLTLYKLLHISFFAFSKLLHLQWSLSLEHVVFGELELMLLAFRGFLVMYLLCDLVCSVFIIYFYDDFCVQLI